MCRLVKECQYYVQGQDKAKKKVGFQNFSSNNHLHNDALKGIKTQNKQTKQ